MHQIQNVPNDSETKRTIVSIETFCGAVARSGTDRAVPTKNKASDTSAKEANIVIFFLCCLNRLNVDVASTWWRRPATRLRTTHKFKSPNTNHSPSLISPHFFFTARCSTCWSKLLLPLVVDNRHSGIEFGVRKDSGFFSSTLTMFRCL